MWTTCLRRYLIAEWSESEPLTFGLWVHVSNSYNTKHDKMNIDNAACCLDRVLFKICTKFHSFTELSWHTGRIETWGEIALNAQQLTLRSLEIALTDRISSHLNWTEPNWTLVRVCCPLQFSSEQIRSEKFSLISRSTRGRR